MTLSQIRMFLFLVPVTCAANLIPPLPVPDVATASVTGINGFNEVYYHFAVASVADIQFAPVANGGSNFPNQPTCPDQSNCFGEGDAGFSISSPQGVNLYQSAFWRITSLTGTTFRDQNYGPFQGSGDRGTFQPGSYTITLDVSVYGTEGVAAAVTNTLSLHETVISGNVGAITLGPVTPNPEPGTLLLCLIPFALLGYCYNLHRRGTHQSAA